MNNVNLKLTEMCSAFNVCNFRFFFYIISFFFFSLEMSLYCRLTTILHYFLCPSIKQSTAESANCRKYARCGSNTVSFYAPV